MSSKDDKKPTGPCAACKKEEATKRCTDCLKCGIETFYCNRECQATNWKTHKAICGTTDNLSMKEAKKVTKRLQKNVSCQNCFKNDIEVGSMSACSKCKMTSYCSRECQAAHWPKHKSICEHNRIQSMRMEKSLDSSEKTNVRLLLKKWADKAHTFIGYSLLYFMKQEEIRDQPPKQILILYLEFNYNLQSFVPAEEPKVVPISDLKEMYSEYNEAALDIDTLYELHKGTKMYLFKSEESYIQFALVTCKQPQSNFIVTIPNTFAESQLAMKKDIDLREVYYYCREVKLNSHVFQGWDAIRASNLQQQTDYLKSSQAYLRFSQNALQLRCNNRKHLKHGIVIHLRMGKEIGQIAELVTYEVKHIAEIIVNMKMRVLSKRKQKELIENELDVRNSPKLLKARQQNPNNIMMVICFVDMETGTTFIADSEVCELPMIPKGNKVKTCNRDAKKYFKELQGVVKEMPSELVKKVSL